MSSAISGQRFIPFDDKQPFDPKVPQNEQIARQVKLSNYSKPVYEFCKYYTTTHYSGYKWENSYSHFENDLNYSRRDQEIFIININIFTWSHYMVAEKYIQKYKDQYSQEPKSAGRRRSQKRPTARRRRSSKARKSSKSRATRRKH
jgi:hypothetical protein